MADDAGAVAVAAQDLVAAYEHDGRVEARGPVGVLHVGELAQEFLVVRSVVAVLARPARGEDPRRAVERVNGKP